MNVLKFIKIDVNSEEHLIQQALNIYLSNPDYFELLGGNRPTRDTLMESLRALPEKLSYDDKAFEIIYRDGEPIGIVDILDSYPEKMTAFIGLLLIDGNLQGRGLGKYVYKKIEDKLKANGVKVIKIGVLENNQPAIKFWKMNGFNILDKKTSTVVNQKISSFYLMAKDI